MLVVGSSVCLQVHGRDIRHTSSIMTIQVDAQEISHSNRVTIESDGGGWGEEKTVFFLANTAFLDAHQAVKKCEMMTHLGAPPSPSPCPNLPAG